MLAYVALVPIAAAIAAIDSVIDLGTLPRLGLLMAGAILASFVDPVGFGWREPSDRSH
jgi:hypothetical protein